MVGEGIPIEGGMTGGRAGEGGVRGVKKAHTDQTGEGRAMVHAIRRLVRRRFLGRQAGIGAARKEGGTPETKAKMSLGGRSGGGRGEAQHMR